MTKVEEILQKTTGRAWNLRIETAPGGNGPAAPEAGPDGNLARTRRQRQEALEKPLVKKAVEVLGAQLLDMDEGFGAEPAAERSGTERTEEF